MIATALQMEVDEYLARYRGERDAVGHALAVRNGRARLRPVLTGVGAVTITAPRVTDRRMVAGRRPSRSTLEQRFEEKQRTPGAVPDFLDFAVARPLIHE